MSNQTCWAQQLSRRHTDLSALISAAAGQTNMLIGHVLLW